jgi:YggT family protein
MTLVLIAQLINLVATVVTILVFVWVVVSWIAPPYHPIREALDRIVDPLLAPIRRVLPGTGPIDFSPLVLIIGIELLARILSGIILSL